MLDDMPDQLGARQFAGIQVAPFGQQLARGGVVAALEGITDVGVVVAELPEAQRQVQDEDVQPQGEQHAEMAQRPVDQRNGQARHQNRDSPDDGGMVLVAGVEVAARPAHPADDRLVHAVAMPQGLELLTQQGQQHREEIHGPG
jgi:hypothetical protein